MEGLLRSQVPGTAETTPGDDEPTRWVVIAIVSQLEAEVMRGKLESEGIPCMLQREAAGSVFGITIGPLGEVRVLVPEPLADRAFDLLNEGGIEDTDEAIDEEEWDDTDADTPKADQS
jgi:hypothetical protein